MALLIVNPPDISGGNYATIPNEWLRDKRLSLVARGILAVLATHRTGFAVRAEDFHGFGTGKETVAKAFRELEEVGYLRRERTRTDRGTWSHVWTLNPQSGPSPDPGKPTVDVTSTNTPSPQVSTSDGIPGSGQPGDSKKPNEKKTSRRGDAPTAASFLSEGMRSWAEENHPHVNVDQATAKYIDWYSDKTTSRKSWEAWIAREKAPRPATATEAIKEAGKIDRRMRELRDAGDEDGATAIFHAELAPIIEKHDLIRDDWGIGFRKKPKPFNPAEWSM